MKQTTRYGSNIHEWFAEGLFSLDKNNPKTMSEILYRATKYMNAEDALLAKEEKTRKRERLEDTR